MNDTRECPYCAENIKKRAKLCRFCNKTVIPIGVNELDEDTKIEEIQEELLPAEKIKIPIRPKIPNGAISCPRCFSPAWGGRGFIIWLFVIILFPVGLLLLLLKPTYKCRMCSYTFKS